MQKVDVTAEEAEMQVKQAGAGLIRALREERELNLLREREDRKSVV